MRVPVIAANWKMNKKIDEAQSFLDEFIPLVWNERDVEIVIAPAFTALYTMANLLKITHIRLAAQNMFYEEKGAYTGEISPMMLTDIGCSHVIIGHSERRIYFGETNEIANKKIGSARKNGLQVIFCIGESLAERESGKTFDVLKKQLDEAYAAQKADEVEKIQKQLANERARIVEEREEEKERVRRAK
jgi:triosephosphate isomerase